MLTISDWAAFQNTSNKKWETRQDRIPTEKGLPLPKGRKFTSEKFHPGTITLIINQTKITPKKENDRPKSLMNLLIDVKVINTMLAN